MIFSPSFILPLLAYTLWALNLRWMILKCDRFRTVTVQWTVCHTILFGKLDFVWPWSQTTDWRFYELAVLRVASVVQSYLQLCPKYLCFMTVLTLFCWSSVPSFPLWNKMLLFSLPAVVHACSLIGVKKESVHLFIHLPIHSLLLII